MAESGSAAADQDESGLVNAVDAVPFMVHVLLVFFITWLLLPVTLNGFFLLCFFIVYLVQVERRGREIERRGIASAERKKINTRRTFDDGETLRWLNEGIKSMWPLCMEKFASKHFFGPMAPYFLDRYKPWIAKEAKMDIESLHLGSTPPVFNFIRALEQPTDGDHVAYEATMEFHSGDDMGAKMSVVTKGGFGTTTFYISRLHIEGKVRISVKFLEGWPVIGRVRFCFASTPQLTMSYKPYNKNFPDVSLIPGVANLVEKMLDNAMGHCIVQPNLLEVDIEALASMLFPDSRTQQGATGISKVENKSTLLVEILEATNLKVADRNGLSDPFVDIQFGGQKKKTKFIRKTLNPRWTNEQHQFSIVNWNMPNLLTLRVRDWDRLPLRPSYDLGIVIVAVNDYQNGERHEFYLPLEGVSTGHLRFAITVNHTHPPRTFEEPRTSDAVCETTTQEIKTDYVVCKSPIGGTTTEMKRSKSDTNLDKLRTPPKHKGRSKRTRYNTTEEPPLLEALQEQTPTDEIHDIIDMPYGPRGAFTICHPGLVQEPVTPPSRKKTNAQTIPKSTELVDDGGAEPLVKPPSRIRRRLQQIRLPEFGKKWKTGTSQENVLTETMSEQSGSLGSIDMSTELKNLNLTEMYHGNVRMDLIGTTDIAGGEPPEMYTPRCAAQLEPSLSGKTASTAPASNSHSVEVPTNGTGEETTASELLEEVDKKGSHSSGGLTVPIAGSKLDERVAEGVSAEYLASSEQQRLGSLRKRKSRKPMISSLPKTWYKKIKSLAAKGGKKKKMHDANGVAYSAELKYASGEYGEGYPDNWDPISRSESFTFESSPLDANHTNNGGTPGSARGDSPEERKLIKETPLSRAAGSQSDRSNWASKMKKRIRDQSKSLRLESLHLRPKLLTPTRTDSSLNSIPERSAGAAHQRNGKVSV